MTQKIVCQLDKKGYYIGTTVADESPLESGVYLMPALTLDAVPPKLFEGQLCRWENGEWKYEDMPIIAQPSPPDLTNDELKKRCKVQAKKLLVDSDWSQQTDVAGILRNKAEFSDYRATVRGLFLRPVPEPVFPEEPDAIWGEQ